MRHKPKTKAQQLKAGIENSLQGFILPFTIKALAQKEESLNPQKMATDNINVHEQKKVAGILKSVIAKYSTRERHLLGLNLTEHIGHKAEKRERKLGKIAHDILVPTRLCSAVFTALTCHVIRAELFVDKQEKLSKTAKFAIKAPLFAARNILATTAVGLKTPELLSMPIARGLKFAATTAPSAFNSAVAKMRANLEKGRAQVQTNNKPKPVSIYANRGSKNNGRSM